jgi:hypothetical protein
MKFDAGAFGCESPDLIHNISRCDRKYADMQTAYYIKTYSYALLPHPICYD